MEKPLLIFTVVLVIYFLFIFFAYRMGLQRRKKTKLINNLWTFDSKIFFKDGSLGVVFRNKINKRNPKRASTFVNICSGHEDLDIFLKLKEGDHVSFRDPYPTCEVGKPICFSPACKLSRELAVKRVNFVTTKEFLKN